MSEPYIHANYKKRNNILGMKLPNDYYTQIEMNTFGTISSNKSGTSSNSNTSNSVNNNNNFTTTTNEIPPFGVYKTETSSLQGISSQQKTQSQFNNQIPNETVTILSLFNKVKTKLRTLARKPA